MKRLLALFAFIAATFQTGYALGQSAEDAFGVWVNPENGSHIEFYPCGIDGLCAKLLRVANGQLTDDKNPDPAKRTRPIVGLVIMDHAIRSGSTHWSGELYNRENGQSYSGRVQVKTKDALELSGCVAVILCRTVTWYRLTAASADPTGPLRTPRHELTPPSQMPSWSGARPPMPEHHGAQSLDAKQVFLAVAPSVYLVVAGRTTEAISRREGVLGSAVAISVDHAITNCHVVQNQPVITVIDEARSYVLRATVVRAHQSTDRCFIRVDGRLQPISGVRRARDVAIGERVYTIGNPSGLTRTLGEGLISGLRRLDGVTYIQTTAQVSPGSSGGALVDERGSLLGITTFLLKDGQNLNFAIAAEEYWR